jgi:membrane associated rhomboid family serine protease
MPGRRGKKAAKSAHFDYLLSKWQLLDALGSSRFRPRRGLPVFPLHDDNPTETFPLFTIGIIVACVLVWILVQGAGTSQELLDGSICSLGAIPGEITGRAVGRGPCPPGGLTWPTLVTSMFLHGGWMHLIGNMWFLWIFGNNVEDSMGRFRFLVFYLLTGLVAAGTQILLNPTSPLPTVGASGAIAGVMGAYIVLYPRARVATLFFFIIFFRIFQVPAWVILGYWILIQVVSQASSAGTGGGVAYGAHIGGFLAGVILIRLFANRDLVRAKRAHVVLHRSGPDHPGW